MIHWVFRDDFAFVKRQLYVYTARLPETTAIDLDRYDAAIVNNIGAELFLAAVGTGTSYCSLWLPPSSFEAQPRRVSGLKVSALLSKPLEATAVHDPDEWTRVCARASNVMSIIDDLQTPTRP